MNNSLQYICKFIAFHYRLSQAHLSSKKILSQLIRTTRKDKDHGLLALLRGFLDHQTIFKTLTCSEVKKSVGWKHRERISLMLYLSPHDMKPD